MKKPALQTKMSDFAADTFPDPERLKTKIIVPTSMRQEDAISGTPTTITTDAWEERDKEIHDYNKRIFDIDEDYASFIPNRFIIVRCFHKEYVRSSGGIIVSEPTMYVPEKTMNGMGNLQTVATPWAFHNLGVIVTMPEGSTGYKVGDILQLGYSVVMPDQKQKLSDWVLPSAFMLFSYQDWTPPTSVKDKHFGYFAVDTFNNIIGKVPRELYDRLSAKN